MNLRHYRFENIFNSITKLYSILKRHILKLLKEFKTFKSKFPVAITVNFVNFFLKFWAWNLKFLYYYFEIV